ncbi:MAG: hydantoinase B/oxoprolinase family protein [Pseudomonadota bacterium]
MGRGWHFWIDRGGTFTDIVARRPDGRLVTAKLLSEDPARYADAAVAGMRRLLKVKNGAPFPAARVAEIRMGTTVATNALLERRGAPTALAITRGFADALAIGAQNRPRLFALRIDKPSPLYAQVVEIDERLDAKGQVLRPLDVADARDKLKAAFAQGHRSLAIVLLHSVQAPEHELALGEVAAAIGFEEISLSHRLAPVMRLIPRGQTTVVNAYLNPVVQRYVAGVAKKVEGAKLYFMQSHGGLAQAQAFLAKDAILSGPAGGVVGAVRTAAGAGFSRLIGFDMGGTSTDVMHYAGAFERAEAPSIAGQRLAVPMLAVHTVAAGGGSILGFDGTRLLVGPQSAGADPGPACYGKGGPATVTDCHVVLGRLGPRYFPKLFGKTGKAPLSTAAAQKAVADLAQRINAASAKTFSVEETAEGYLAIAVEHMARAIKAITIERGHDIAEHVLVSFGGAGGQMACRVAAALGVRRVMVHPLAGVLSALGIGLAPLQVIRERALEMPLDESTERSVSRIFTALAKDAAAALRLQKPGLAHPSEIREAHLKYAGSDAALAIVWQGLEPSLAAFAAAHRQRYGFAEPDKPVILERLSVTLREREGPVPRASAAILGGKPRPNATQPVFIAGAWREVPFYERARLPAGARLAGPAILLEATATTIIEPGWSVLADDAGNLVLTHDAQPPQDAGDTRLDPIRLEVFNHLFMAIAEQMGTVLERTAHSVNIKERLDFSCAVFDRDGDLVANAPHMPVHLGSMGETVKALIGAIPDLVPDMAYALNDPYHGGTHLPDITVVTPVFLEGERTPAFFVAARGHHADVGGLTPGSMPPDSTRIEEEGALFHAVPLIADGRFAEATVRRILEAGPYPARNPAQNIADLKAQIAANAKGVAELRAMVTHFGVPMVAAYMAHIQEAAESAVRRAVLALPDGACDYALDNGAVISVALRIDRDNGLAAIDFSGTSAQGAHNYNAPLAITRAAVLYALRCLVDADIPLNAGCLKPIRLIVPEGSLLNPRPPAAVVAGNVETSQAVTNALFLAMGVAAASQGTMNNLSFGNERHQYYETLAGGTGAGPGFAGADAVHSHMTNSRLTDPEVVEGRYPVLIERFAIRRGSGGKGAFPGGNGLVREIRFLEAMTVSILANHRASGPPGLAGGDKGAPGSNRVIRADGGIETLAAAAKATLCPADRIVIETPGGGGYGKEKT